MKANQIRELWPELTAEESSEIESLLKTLVEAAALPRQLNVDAYLKPLASGAHTMLAWAIEERGRLFHTPTVRCIRRATEMARVVVNLLADRNNPEGELPQYWDRPLSKKVGK